MRFLHPPDWVRPKGYANGVEARGRMVFVSGMVGWDASGKFVSTDFLGQVEQALKNVIEVLKQGNAKPEHIVRMTWYVVDKQEYIQSLKEIGLIYRKIMGWHYPAMSAVQVVALVEDGARVEIEATAVVPD
jgi:enamine deaminase RidA (YjgF/YER057c/UK114 family)